MDETVLDTVFYTLAVFEVTPLVNRSETTTKIFLSEKSPLVLCSNALFTDK
jgi:hypothetical protein